MSQVSPTILCVDNDPESLDLLTMMLKHDGYHVVLTQIQKQRLNKSSIGYL
jgi:CheY-like chemotaxis protein